MDSSISDKPKRVDLYDKSDWAAILVGGGSSSASRLASARDPLSWLSEGPPPDAVWGFHPVSGELRVLLGDPIDGLREKGNAYETARSRLRCYAYLAPTLVSLLKFRPSIQRIVEIMAFEGQSKDHLSGKVTGSSVRRLAKTHALQWFEGKDMILAALYEKNLMSRSVAGGPENIVAQNREAFIRTMKAVYDYYGLRQPLWKSVPSSLFATGLGEQEHSLRVFSDPLAFDPRERATEDAFLWPWQRCIDYCETPRANMPISYRPVRTTSLALDIRGSTSAMDLSTDSARYAEFIDSVVTSAKRVLLDCGGFFDKETGDGLVGHFCHATLRSMKGITLEQADAETTYTAISAAVRLIKEVQSLCREYQTGLMHGMDGLGPAVGIHTADSVWLVDHSQVRAIGASVVGAARLCAKAASSEVLISNHSFVSCTPRLPADRIAMFVRKPIEVQEFSARLGLYAYALSVKEEL